VSTPCRPLISRHRATNDTFEWGVESAFSDGGTYCTGGTAMLPPFGDPGPPPGDLRSSATGRA